MRTVLRPEAFLEPRRFGLPVALSVAFRDRRAVSIFERSRTQMCSEARIVGVVLGPSLSLDYFCELISQRDRLPHLGFRSSPLELVAAEPSSRKPLRSRVRKPFELKVSAETQQVLPRDFSPF